MTALHLGIVSALPSAPGMATVVEYDIEQKIGAALQEMRGRQKIYRTQLAEMLGIKESGLRRHELGKTKVTVSRLIQICDFLEASPIDVLVTVAPHLFGKSDETTSQIATIVKILTHLDAPALASVLGVVQHFTTNLEITGRIS